MKRMTLFGSILIALLAGCASTARQDAAPPAPQAAGAGMDESSSAEDKESEIQELGRKLEIARARLSLARLEEKSYAEQQEVKLRHATAEIDLAKASLAHFREADMPNRLADEKLDLQITKDRAQEAAEELAQIEIMYKEQDLDDLTAEFVVSRGRRNAERAAARIEIREGMLKALEERELPQEEERLALALDKALAGLEEIGREAEIGQHKKGISVREAENEVTRLEEELAELREEANE